MLLLKFFENSWNAHDPSRVVSRLADVLLTSTVILNGTSICWSNKESMTVISHCRLFPRSTKCKCELWLFKKRNRSRLLYVFYKVFHKRPAFYTSHLDTWSPSRVERSLYLIRRKINIHSTESSAGDVMFSSYKSQNFSWCLCSSRSCFINIRYARRRNSIFFS